MTRGRRATRGSRPSRDMIWLQQRKAREAEEAQRRDIRRALLEIAGWLALLCGLLLTFAPGNGCGDVDESGRPIVMRGGAER